MGILVILLMVFLFAGEPDLWDNLHKYAMQATTIQKEKCVNERTN